MIKITRVYLNRAEGPRGQTGRATTDSLDAANRILKTAATTAPKSGDGYNKVDFKVVWEDGEEYEGRYDMTYEDTWKADLGNQIRRFMNFYGGLERPYNMTEEQYETFLVRNEKQTKVPRKAYVDFLKGRQTY